MFKVHFQSLFPDISKLILYQFYWTLPKAQFQSNFHIFRYCLFNNLMTCDLNKRVKLSVGFDFPFHSKVLDSFDFRV